MSEPAPSRAACIHLAARRMRSDRRGVAAIEFALVGTLLLIATLGFFETVLIVRAQTLLSSVVANMAELVAAQSGVPIATLTDYCGGARLTMAPYPTTSLSMAVASVTHSSTSGNTARDWEYDGACPTAAAAIGSAGAAALGGSMVPNGGDSVIIIKASYTYTPSINVLLSSITLKQTAFARPIRGAVACSNC